MIKGPASTVLDIMSRLRVYFQGDHVLRNYNREEPFRSELYSSDQLNRHGQVVARSHKLMKGKPSDQLLKRLDENEKTLLAVRNLLVESVKSGQAITPAGEWLLDNFYLIEEQMVIARKHLPKGYSEGLPCLSEGVSAGMPRVYDIVLEIISHSDGRVDIKSLSSFIDAYQSHTILTLGELWAIPIMLRLAVIENLCRVSGRIALDMIDHNLANYWADKMTVTAQEEPGNLILTIADLARSKPVLLSPFVSAFFRKLQGKGPALALPLSWMEQQLAGAGVSSNDLIRLENQKQAADQVSVRNSIGTLRSLSTTDWREFVETLSAVEQVLKEDTTGTYPLMDFATRDRYRHVVEGIAKAAKQSEIDVARKVLELANQPQNEQSQFKKRQHVGYYLIDKGLAETHKVCGMRFTIRQHLSNVTKRAPVFVYLFSIALLTVSITLGLWYMEYVHGITGWLLLSVTALLSLSCAAQLAVSLVNWIATITVKPVLLPRMDFSRGIPTEYRTLVIVPTMLTDADYIDELVEALEIRFLANREPNLHFGLLTDFADADAETMPTDEALLTLARERIEALNLKYRQDGFDLFFLFHRARTWNAKEGKWMGYERKRGKLSDLNAYLKGKGQNPFALVYGQRFVLSNIKYVITLDSDTQLPREAVWKIVATMAHPLNRPVYDRRKKRITEGYAILQPRVASAIPKGAPTLYSRMQGDMAGIDPYTRVSSDVYQDLFGEGSFIGKGIYDVDLFEQAVRQVFPENRILSHDLLEGCYARSGLLSDINLYEENPAQYATDIKRHHRWIRGDWQIAAWLLPWVRKGNNRLTTNKLSGLSRWKIFDNLRRSLLPPSLLLLLLLGWTVLPFPWFWTLSITLILLLPIIAATTWQLIHKPLDLTLKAHLTEIGNNALNVVARFLFGLTVLPFEAYTYTDAILRTNWRMLISRKHLLQWTTSAAASNHAPHSVWAMYRAMWVGPFISVATIGTLCYLHPQALPVATPFLLLWFFSPSIAWYLSKPEAAEEIDLPIEQTVFLHQAARKTWSFFEQFVTASENWLPPDNFQEQPEPVIAHRTSPTNMGLALLANLTAYDFGYIAGGELIQRCRQTLQSMLQLERYRGHFYNWYDTLSLLPLQPRYVSTVDSGNLAGHLLTLRQGLLTLPNQPVFDNRIFDGLQTTAQILLTLHKKHHTEAITALLDLLHNNTDETGSLIAFHEKTTQLLFMAQQLTTQENGHEPDVLQWSQRLQNQITNISEDLAALIPWSSLLPVPAAFGRLSAVESIPSLTALSNMQEELVPILTHYTQQTTDPQQITWLTQMKQYLVQGSDEAQERIMLLNELTAQCEQLSDVAYDFLLDKSTSLLRIGYNVDHQRKDDSYYDLLASEARLGIFVGIAQGKLPQESWFALGRLLTNSGGDPILLSWSGSMFEYLMPQLIMPSFDNTLLQQTSKATVKRQIEYATQRAIPWGISESAYNMVDTNLNYQYRAFGVPGLGLKRGLEEDLVIAPYATMLALMVLPAKACANLQLMAHEGFEGRFGFYEAVDYTSARLPRGKDHTIVRSYMVHHQGMSLLSLAYLLLNKPMQQRFVSELRFQATLLLLQERIPRATLFYAHTADVQETHTHTADVPVRKTNTPNTPTPEIQLLGNGRYQVMVTNSGGGYSRWKDIAVTRWREDITKDNKGIFCYIKDVDTGKFWSNTYQPTLQPAKHYEVTYAHGHIEFHRQDDGFDTRTEIVISPEDDTEMRRIRITNRTQSVKVLEITSYAEVVLAAQAADEAHPAFSNLFVQTEILPEQRAIVCTRRPRSAEEQPPWMFHLMNVHGASTESVSYETDRMRFTGRSRTLVHPLAMDEAELSGSEGAVLDPVAAIRFRISIKPNHTATIDLVYGMSESKMGCENLMHKYRDQHLKNRAFELSWTHSQVLLRQINATEAEAQLYDRLAAYLIYPHAAFRAEPGIIQSNFRGQSGLWSHSISGDIPIVLLHIYDPENIELVRQMVQAHAYWRLKGLDVDLVIWNEDHGTYRQLLQDQILGLITAEAVNHQVYNKPGSIFVKSADQLSPEDRILFASIARIIIQDDKGTLTEQVNRTFTEHIVPPLLESKPPATPDLPQEVTLPAGLLYFNGTGGFTPDGKEYKIITTPGAPTPAPWANVIANPDFGTVVSESGSAYTWAVNAHEYRLTPWSNDPVSDMGGEAFYIRDEESGFFWSPAPFPRKSAAPYITTHGFGYTRFEHAEHGIATEMCVFVDKTLPVKFVVLKIKNQSGRERKLSATGFMDIIMGDLRTKTSMHITSEQDTTTGALLLKNRYNTPFTERVTFFKTEGAQLSYTFDRTAFVGRNRNLSDPIALYRKKLSGRSGAGMDPCAALQVKFDLLNGAEKEIIFLLGNEAHTPAAQILLRKFEDREAVMQALEDVKSYWAHLLTGIQINSPDTALNIWTNGWLTYQTLASRIFARSGFYQSGGAFGFRDQLQDALSLLFIQPELVKAQILLNASRQFAEGDVQHWWHPPEGRGVRTRCSDDLLWLPFVVARYIDTTGDTDLLQTQVGFLESRLLHHDEDSVYDLPVSGNLSGTLYEHCVRAISYGHKKGVHGLPLIGSGDWNDGMDRVGNQGKGESVWLAFFRFTVLQQFEGIAHAFGDNAFATACQEEALTLQQNIETHSWDGDWYLRAFFDDGTPLGSAQNESCRIDAIAQSWAVLSGAATPQRQQKAMIALDQHLVKRSMGLIQLLDPPFDGTGPNPGYIKGYVPGVRENGGQYSHAAIWALMAFAQLGDREKVWELFNLVLPMNHTRDAAAVQVYKAEPYVMAADVYANKTHEGRGGWSWYTGSAGWMYQFLISSLLGLRLQADRLTFKPCFPLQWPSVTIDFRYGNTVYNITVYQLQDETPSRWKTDNTTGVGNTIPLNDDGNTHTAEVYINIVLHTN